MKLVDVLDSKSSGPCARASSTLASGTKQIGRSEGSERLFYWPGVGWNGMEASLNRRLIVCSVEFFPQRTDNNGKC